MIGWLDSVCVLLVGSTEADRNAGEYGGFGLW